MTERASPSSESNCTAIISAFVRADVIAVLLFFGSVLALSVTFGDIARVAAPSVCYAVACILLAAAPNSSSLFPPLAAVVAVAPKGEASGEAGKFFCNFVKPA